MKDSYVGDASQARRSLNAVALQNAALCAECDVVSDSPHDRCLVCGSRLQHRSDVRREASRRPRKPDCFRHAGSDAIRSGPQLSRASANSREGCRLNRFAAT
jgi:hypothetical protein